MASNSQSPGGEKNCCFKQCNDRGGKILGLDSSRVEVKAFEPKRKKGEWLVTWASEGSASFHRQCWSLLVSATQISNQTGLLISDVERSMIIEAKKTVEYHDSQSDIQEEAKRIVEILQGCKYCIAFTGAGISTAAGIGDFRGKDGKWTERDKAKNFGHQPAKGRTGVSMERLRPTYTHEALCKLMDKGVLKFIISQNVDGLHQLSGIPADKISELHGNTLIEKCEDCDTRYQLKHHWRYLQPGSFPAKKCNRCKISHRTGRKCSQPGCNGYLMNTIINFGDYLESAVLSTAEYHARKADCVLILGSSLRVSPAKDLVVMGQKPLKLIICNRQTTPYDEHCQGPDSYGCRVHGDCDVLMQNVMQQLLPLDQLREWESGKEARRLQYDLLRSV